MEQTRHLQQDHLVLWFGKEIQMKNFGINKLGINRLGTLGTSGSRAWTPRSLGSKVVGWFREADEVAGQQPNKVTGASDYLTIASGSGLNKVYTLPNTTPYKNADTDYCWWKSDSSLSTSTGSRLISFDFARTIIKYDNATPYVLREIIILAAGATLTIDEMNSLRDYAQLSIWWNNVSSDHGMIKGNRSGEQSIWTPEITTDASALALFAQMTVLGDAPTDAEKTNHNTFITGLKAAGLWDTMFDVLVFTRNFGSNSYGLNWINPTGPYNGTAVSNGGTFTFTPNGGVHGDGSKSYMRTNWKPTNGVLFTQNDAHWMFKLTIPSYNTGQYHGLYSSGGLYYGTYGEGGLNDGGANTSTPLVTGYTLLSKVDSSGFTLIRNTTSNYFARVSTALKNYEMYMLACNAAGTVNYWVNANNVMDCYSFGKSMTQNQFNTFRTLCDAFIAGQN
jgi:hypothetical protein